MPLSSRCTTFVVAPIIAAFFLASCASPPEPLACADIPGLVVDGVQILAAEEIPAGDLGRAHCKITGVADRAITMTRPLCPYPQVAIYDGSGDPNAAASFSCGMRGER